MGWILAAVVTLGFWLLAVGLPYAAWSRWRLRRTPDVFTCRIRAAGPLEGARWPRRRRYASWVHGVLLVHRGPSMARCEALPVASLTGPVVGGALRGLGERAVQLRLHLDDGRLFDLAVRNADVNSAIGPFVVASLKAPRP